MSAASSRDRARLRGLGRGLARALRDAARGAARRPLPPLAALGTLTVCLLLTGLAGLVAWNAGRLTERWSGGSHMTIYLEDETTSQRAAQLAEVVRRLPGVLEATLVSPKEAHARMRAALGERGELLDGVEEGFLPASIDVRTRSGVGALLRAHPAFQRLSTTAGVEEIDLHVETAERLEGARRLLVRGALILAVLVVLATLYLFSTTTRLGVEARRDELSVLRLVGATERFVRAPFLVEGAAIGLVAAAISTAAVWAAYRAAAPRIVDTLGGWLAAAPIAFPPASVVALGLVAGAALGFLGASAAFGRERA